MGSNGLEDGEGEGQHLAAALAAGQVLETTVDPNAFTTGQRAELEQLTQRQLEQTEKMLHNFSRTRAKSKRVPVGKLATRSIHGVNGTRGASRADRRA